MNHHASLCLIMISVLCLALGGCAGAWLVHEGTGMTFEGSTAALQKEQGYVSPRTKEQTETSEEDALRLWGPPDQTYFEDESEVLVYRRELAFSGAVVLLMGVNIPFLAPVGYRHTHLYFKDGVLSKVILKSGQDGPGVICGFMFNISSGGWSFECGKIQGDG